MNFAKLSIKRPIFMTCIMLLIIVAGLVCFRSLSVDYFPEVDIPYVSIATIYPGAGPSEVETLVTKPIEDELSSVSGLKRITSKSIEGFSQIVTEFNAGVDGKYAEQQVRDKVGLAKVKLPRDTKEPLIQKVDLTALPIMTLTLSARLNDAELYDLANDVIKPRLEQVDNVGKIEIVGGRKREIQVLLDREKLKARELSLRQVSGQLAASGENIPSGKVNVGEREKLLRSLGAFQSVDEISETLVNLFGNEVPTRISDLGVVRDTLEDEKSRVYLNGQKSLFIQVSRQSGSNTVAVADAVKKRLEGIRAELKTSPGEPDIQVLRDSSDFIRDNVNDVYETIIIAIILTVITVLYFLGSGRTTMIAVVSLPISLIGGFILMYFAHFSINIISLIALSLAVGLLVDDAIVVIENIHRRIEGGESPEVAADKGTAEIQLAVIAISLVVISVFAPVAFMSDIVGQFLKQFGLTVAFTMIISLFVALTVIPMLAAFFNDDKDHEKRQHLTQGRWWKRPFGASLQGFEEFQTWIQVQYERILRYSLSNPIRILIAGFAVFTISILSITRVPGTFVPEGDQGELTVNLDLPSGVNLDGTQKAAFQAEQIIRRNDDVLLTTVTVGGKNGEANQAELYIKLKPAKIRNLSTIQFQENIRQQLAEMAYAKPIVKAYEATSGASGGNRQPLMINLIGSDQGQLEGYASQVLARLKTDPRLKDVDSTYRQGKPEFQVHLKEKAARTYGVNSRTMGEELRGQVEGFTPAKFRVDGREYDVRVRLREDQRDLQKDFHRVFVPNVNYRLVKLADIAEGKEAVGAAAIERLNRGRYIEITANIASGTGLSEVIKDVESLMTSELKPPVGIRYAFAGDSERYQDMMVSMVVAIGFALLLIYLVLSSLYESFVTPFTILLALPFALCGGFLALYLGGQTLNLLGFLGVFLLLGVAGKNSILLVDFARQIMATGTSRTEALVAAGKARIRPILMTSFALIAGTLPVAFGLNEASKMRSSMGYVVIGGLISSTLLTLIVVPVAFTYVDDFRAWCARKLSRFLGQRKKAGSQERFGDLPDEVLTLDCERGSDQVADGPLAN